ncbi:transglycosylase SLT domain-containing protein [Azospirillum palustre]
MNAEDFLNGGAAPTVDDHIAEAAQRFGISPDLIRATMGAESDGDPLAISNKGASGLMQVMPDTFQDMRRQHGLGADRFDPRTNVLAGTAYLRQMLDRFGDPQLALAAYNAGPGRVDQHLATGAPLPAETRAYVPRVLTRMGGHGAQRAVDPLSLLPNDAVLIGGTGADTVENPFAGLSAEGYLGDAVGQIMRSQTPGDEYASAVRDTLSRRREAEGRRNAPDPMALLPSDAVLLSGPDDPLASLPPDAVILSADDFLGDAGKNAPGILSTFGTAAARGAGEAIRNTANAPSFSQDRPAEAKEADGIDELLTTPISKGWTDPKWWAAQIGAGIGGSAPTVAAGIAGGAAGSVVAGPPGALVGSALGFGGGSFVQSLAPEYQRARAEGLDHDAAVDRALQQSGIAGAFGAAMGLAPGVGLFGKTAEGAIKRPISEALAQIFGVQPGLGVGQRATQNAAAGRETTAEELLQDYALNAGAGAAMVGAHKGVERMARRGAKLEETSRPAAEPGDDPLEAFLAGKDIPERPAAQDGATEDTAGQPEEVRALPPPSQAYGDGFVMGEQPEDRFTPAETQRREKEAADLDALIERRTREMGFLQDQIPAESDPAERARKMELFRRKNRQVEEARDRLSELRPEPIGPLPPKPSRRIGETDPEDALRALPAPDLVRGEGFTLGQDAAALASAQEAMERQQRADTLRATIDKLTGHMGALQEQIGRETDIGERRRKTALFRTKAGKLDAARAELDSLEPRAVGPQPPAPSRRIDMPEAMSQGQQPEAPRLALPRPDAAYGEGFTMGSRPAANPPETRLAEAPPPADRIDLEARRLAVLDRRMASRTSEMDGLRWRIAQTVDPTERARMADEFRAKVRDLSQTRTQASEMRDRLDRMRADAAPPAPGDRVRVTYGRTGETYEATFEGTRGPRTLVRRDDGRLFTPITSAHTFERTQQPAPASAGQRRSAQPKAASLFQFLASKGGVQDQGGELRTMDLHRAFVPGGGKLVRTNGLPLDRARELAAEAGYLRPSDRGDRFGRTDVADLLDAIDREARGAKVYPLDDTADMASSSAGRRQAEEEAFRLDAARREVAEYTESIGLKMPPDEADGASRLMIEDGIAADEAVAEMIERSMIAHEAEFSKRQEETNDGSAIPFEELGGEDRGASRGPVADGGAAGRGPAAGAQRPNDGGRARPEGRDAGDVAQARSEGAGRVAEPFLDERFSIAPDIEDVAPALEADLRARLQRYGIDDRVALTMVDAIRSQATGQPIPAGRARYTRGLIETALSAPDKPRAVDHETIHALRDLGAFTPAEWNALRTAAMADRQRLESVRSRYEDQRLSNDRLAEEVAAEMFADWRAGRAQPKGILRTMVERVRDLLTTIRNALRGEGFETAASVFRAIERGEVGRRAGSGGPATGTTERFQIGTAKPPGGGPKETPEQGIRKAAKESAASVLGHARDSAAGRWAEGVVHDLQMFAVPMARGTDATRAIAKDFANAMRVARWRAARFDDALRKEFTDDQRRTMWEVADRVSVAEQTGGDIAATGWNELTPRQQQALKAMRAWSEATWERAKAAGIVQGDGLPGYMPRLLVRVGADGTVAPLEKGSEAIPLDQIGQNLRTAGPKHRAYLTSAETLEAARKKFGDDVDVVRDVRALPLAVSRLERAVAGRELINAIRKFGQSSGADLVSETDRPGFFTLSHPAFRTFRPKLVEDPITGQMVPPRDPDGNKIRMMETVPLFVHKDFEGPLRAVLTSAPGGLYSAAMRLKGGAMSAIMWSPLIHNMVEWGRALPVMPGKVLTLKVYFEGNAAKQDPAFMERAIDAGLTPIGGHRGATDDLLGIGGANSLEPGRGLIATGLRKGIGTVSPGAGRKVAEAIDRFGDFWHGTLLWDRIGDLQMGLYKNVREDLMRRRVDEATASRIAAHFANRYAGALPKEAMGETATRIANLAMFSRTFTIGNLGVMKDMLTGLPSEVRSQIARDAGELQAKAAVSMARKKALHAFLIDVGMMYAANSLLQSGLNVMMRDSSLDKEAAGYVERFQRLLKHMGNDPFSVLNPFHLLESLTPNSGNEPGKEGRVFWGLDSRGTGIYLRNPAGKIGEEFQGYLTRPLDMLKAKLSTIARPSLEVLSNDHGFGRPVYNAEDTTPAGMARAAGNIVTHFMQAQFPTGTFETLRDVLTGSGDQRMARLKLAGELTGFTFSQGAPGGPKRGALLAAERRHEADVKLGMPAVNKLLKDADSARRDGRAEEAKELRSQARRMMRDMKIPQDEQKWRLRSAVNPGKVSPERVKEFRQIATPEERERFDRLRKARP